MMAPASAQGLRKGCVVRWHDPPQHGRTIGRGEIQRIDVVFQQDRNAVEWATTSGPKTLFIEGRSLAQGLRVHGNDRPERWTSRIVGGDPVQIAFDKLDSGQRARIVRGLDVDDACLEQIERISPRLAPGCRFVGTAASQQQHGKQPHNLGFLKLHDFPFCRKLLCLLRNAVILVTRSVRRQSESRVLCLDSPIKWAHRSRLLNLDYIFQRGE